MKSWWIDISIYNQTIPWKLWIDHGLAGVIIKHGQCAWRDVWFERHLGDARDAGLGKVGVRDLAAYHWPDPGYSMRPQIDFVLAAIQKYLLDFWDEDVEQWWKKQAQYFAALKGQLPWSAVEKLPPEVILRQYLMFSDEVSRATELMLYSANWFVQTYCPTLTKKTTNLTSHIAEYFDYGNKYYRLTWEQFENLLNFLQKPKQMLPGQTTWRMWQFSSRIILPGCDYPVDLNLMNGEDFTTPPPEIPKPTLVLKTISAPAWVLKAMSGPGTHFKVLAYPTRGTQVWVDPTSQKYGYLYVPDKGWWLNGYYLK